MCVEEDSLGKFYNNFYKYLIFKKGENRIADLEQIEKMDLKQLGYIMIEEMGNKDYNHCEDLSWVAKGNFKKNL